MAAAGASVAAASDSSQSRKATTFGSWAVAFGALILVEIAAKMGYVRTAIWLTAWGALGALLAFRARPAADVDGGAAR